MQDRYERFDFPLCVSLRLRQRRKKVSEATRNWKQNEWHHRLKRLAAFLCVLMLTLRFTYARMLQPKKTAFGFHFISTSSVSFTKKRCKTRSSPDVDESTAVFGVNIKQAKLSSICERGRVTFLFLPTLLKDSDRSWTKQEQTADKSLKDKTFCRRGKLEPVGP